VDSTAYALWLGSKGLVIDARGPTVSEKFNALFVDSTAYALWLGSKGLVIDARGPTVSEDALLGAICWKEPFL
jgi:hypothetical protein